MNKTDRSVVRNQAYRATEFQIRERHNERKNECYGNGDIQSERSHLNVHFKYCEDTYEQAFKKLLDDGIISTRGQKADAKVFDELVFDINSDYFDRNGGYEYAKSFFEEVYRLAVKEAGDERYVLSAIMHADERNKALSEQSGKDIYHYHLHVVYVPIVEKKVLWSKRCKDPALVGTVKEVINQVSHSKKWSRIKTEKGWINSYSLLQDRFFEHMRGAGFHGFERGERGSTTEHLNVLDYKIKKDKEQAAELNHKIQKNKEQAVELDSKIEKKQERLSDLREKITYTKQSTVVFSDIEEMSKKTIFGKVELSPDNWEKVSEMAKEAVILRVKVKELNEKLNKANEDIKRLRNRLQKVLDETKELREALRLFPQRVREFLAELFNLSREQREKDIQKKKGRYGNEL